MADEATKEPQEPAKTNPVTDLVDAAKRRAMATSPTVRLIGLTGLGIVAAAIFLLASAGNVSFETLYSGLSADDTSRIVERLGRTGVQFELEEGTIRVPSSKVHETRLSLASEGLPSSGGSGFELFDEQRFGESEFTEQIQYHRALEGELSRTIGHLAGVERARVHLVLPERSLFVERDGSASASVVLHLAPGWQVREQQAAGIVHLIASSVRGMEPDSVTLVDGEGRAIGSVGEDEIGDSLAYRQRIETGRQRSLQSLLDETVGPGVARVEVSAEVNFRREERTEERYLPKEVAPRSFSVEEERDASAAQGGGGVPGAASNLPGGEPAENAGSTAGLTRRSETRNFEVSKTVRHAVEPVGQLVRQSIAVVVDGTWEGETFTARPDEELDRIREITSAAAGLDVERGDSLTVTCVPFNHAVAVGPVDPLAPIRPYEPYFPYIGGLIGLLLAGLFLSRIKKKLKKAKEDGDTRSALGMLTGTGSPDEQLLDTKEITPGSVREMLLGQGDTKAAEVASEVQNLAAELAAEDPLRAARIIRGWILSDGKEKKEEAAA